MNTLILQMGLLSSLKFQSTSCDEDLGRNLSRNKVGMVGS